MHPFKHRNVIDYVTSHALLTLNFYDMHQNTSAKINGPALGEAISSKVNTVKYCISHTQMHKSVASIARVPKTLTITCCSIITDWWSCSWLYFFLKSHFLLIHIAVHSYILTRMLKCDFRINQSSRFPLQKILLVCSKRYCMECFWYMHPYLNIGTWKLTVIGTI